MCVGYQDWSSTCYRSISLYLALLANNNNYYYNYYYNYNYNYVQLLQLLKS